MPENNLNLLLKNFDLTIDQYMVLEDDEKMEYCDIKFKEYVDIELNETRTYEGFLNPCFLDYFKLCGCVVINFDFGICQFDVTRETNDKFISSIFARNRLYKKLKKLSCGESSNFDNKIDILKCKRAFEQYCFFSMSTVNNTDGRTRVKRNYNLG